jgi:regulator of protease activity HflC (stomatin/prohibitin superfamily)
MLAEASAEAIRRITVAVGDQTGPMLYLLGEKYVAALDNLGQSANAKTIIMPADLQESLRGMIGRLAPR